MIFQTSQVCVGACVWQWHINVSRKKMLRFAQGPVLLVSETEKQRKHLRSKSAMVVYNRSVCVGVCGSSRQEQTKTEKRGNRFVWGGAGIPPEPQLTQTQKNISQSSDAALAQFHWFQLKHSSKYRPLALSQTRKLEIVLFLLRKQSIQDTCHSFVH